MTHYCPRCRAVEDPQAGCRCDSPEPLPIDPKPRQAFLGMTADEWLASAALSALLVWFVVQVFETL